MIGIGRAIDHHQRESPSAGGSLSDIGRQVGDNRRDPRIRFAGALAGNAQGQHSAGRGTDEENFAPVGRAVGDEPVDQGAQKVDVALCGFLCLAPTTADRVGVEQMTLRERIVSSRPRLRRTRAPEPLPPCKTTMRARRPSFSRSRSTRTAVRRTPSGLDRDMPGRGDSLLAEQGIATKPTHKQSSAQKKRGRMRSLRCRSGVDIGKSPRLVGPPTLAAIVELFRVRSNRGAAECGVLPQGCPAAARVAPRNRLSY